ncbi:MAG: FtsW/RodA/SpoVE family cell cycle protein [Lachnospirales bacterium]
MSKENKKTSRSINSHRGIDQIILVCVFVLVLFGIIMVFSSSYYNTLATETPYKYLIKQGTFAAIGGVVTVVAINFPYNFFKLKFRGLPAIATLFYYFTLFLVFYTDVFGKAVKGKRRWLETPIGSIQSSELGKVSLIIFIAYLISRSRKILDTKEGLFFMSIPIFAMVCAIGLQDFSMMLIAAAVGIGMMFVASTHTKIFIQLGIVAFIVLVTFLLISIYLDLYRGARVIAWLDPFSTDFGYQIRQSLYGIASGGLLGIGLGNSRIINFLPEGHNDIIFAIVCEELGLLGAIIVLGLFATIVWRGFKIALTCTDFFGSLIAVGISIMFAVQMLVNVAVVTNLIPNTGIPLPFISAGGSSLIVSMGTMGILLNISKDCNYNKR